MSRRAKSRPFLLTAESSLESRVLLSASFAGGLGGSGVDWAKDLVVDSSGSVITVGHFGSTGDFDPGEGTAILKDGGTFITKLDKDGEHLWSKQIATHRPQFVGGANSVFVDNQDEIYVVGGFQGVVDFDPGAGTDIHQSVNGDGAFILKLTAAGSFEWARTIASNGGSISASVTAHAVTGDDFDSIYVTGDLHGSADLDPGPGSAIHSSGLNGGGFTLRLTVDGAYVWSQDWNARLFDIAVDATGHHFVTGSVSSGAFTAKLNDVDGTLDWAKFYTRESGGATGRGITVDASGNSYTTGDYRGTVDFDPGPAKQSFSSNGSGDIFVTRLDADGQLDWAYTAGAVGLDSGFAIDVVDDGTLFVTGRYANTVDFDAGPGISTITSTAGSPRTARTIGNMY